MSVRGGNVSLEPEWRHRVSLEEELYWWHPYPGFGTGEWPEPWSPARTIDLEPPTPPPRI